jgi:hypothetical protein
MDKQDMMIQQMARQANALIVISRWVKIWFFTMLGFTVFGALFNLAASVLGGY